MAEYITIVNLKSVFPRHFVFGTGFVHYSNSFMVMELLLEDISFPRDGMYQLVNQIKKIDLDIEINFIFGENKEQ